MPNRSYLLSIRVRGLLVLCDLGQILKSVLWNMKALSMSQQSQRPVLSIIPCGFHLLSIEGLRMARHMCPFRQHGQVGMGLLRQRLSLACL